jgi:hypothetical protein
MAKHRRYRVVGYDGDACHRCGQPTQIREHPEITPKLRNQGCYFTRWFMCVNPNCPTTTINPPRFAVWRNARVEDDPWNGGVLPL